jgi:type IV pilus assembly protein PilN
MIRINLLPAAKKQARAAAGGGGGTTGWYIAYIAAALVMLVACGLLYLSKQRELSEQLARNQALERRIAEVTQQSANIDEVRAQLQRSQDLEQVVAELQRARFGPTRVLMELSRILSAGGGPSIDQQALDRIRQGNPLAGFNRSWDTHRLWVTAFNEEDRTVTIRGLGKTNEDVAEFLRRLALSRSFADVHLDRTEATEDTATHLPVIAFTLSATVRY